MTDMKMKVQCKDDGVWIIVKKGSLSQSWNLPGCIMEEMVVRPCGIKEQKNNG
jgi:hypothetical protein